MGTLDIDLTLTLTPECQSASESDQHLADSDQDGFVEDRAPRSRVAEETRWVGSSWDLMNGLDLVESEPGELFDQFFDSESGTARDFAAQDDLTKDQWLRAFAVELAGLDQQLEPREVIQLGNLLWRKKRHLAPESVARDVHSTGWWLVRRARNQSPRAVLGGTAARKREQSS